jgi:hypothetical protein
MIYYSLAEAIAAIRNGAVSGLIIRENSMAYKKQKGGGKKPPKRY